MSELSCGIVISMTIMTGAVLMLISNVTSQATGGGGTGSQLASGPSGNWLQNVINIIQVSDGPENIREYQSISSGIIEYPYISFEADFLMATNDA